MLCIYNYIPETNHVSRCNVAVVLYLQFVLHVMLFRMLNMFCTFTLALIIIIIIIINCRDSQRQTTVYKSYHEKATDVEGDEGG